MSRFTEFLEKALREDVAAEPGYSDNASFGNADNNKYPVLKKEVGVKTSDEVEDTSVQKLIDDNDISIDVDTVETIIALVEKGLNDWNREKKLDSKEIENIVIKGIESGLINVK